MTEDNLNRANQATGPVAGGAESTTADSAQQSGRGSSSDFAGSIDKDFIINRAKAVITEPKAVWTTIQSEPDTVAGLYRRYIAVLAAIPAVCQYVGMVVFGLTIPFFGTFRWPIIGGLVSSIVTYALSLAMIYVCAKIIQTLAPKFGGAISELDAVKTVGYSMTPGLVGGFLHILPVLAPLVTLLGLYSIYVFYQGLARMSGVPESNRVKFFVVTCVANIVAGIVLGFVTMAVTPTPPMPEIDASRIAEGLNVDPNELQRSVEHFQKAFKDTPATAGE